MAREYEHKGVLQGCVNIVRLCGSVSAVDDGCLMFDVVMSDCSYLGEEDGDGEVPLAHPHHLMGSRKLAL